MLILAIDPGPEQSGYVLYDSERQSIIYSEIVENYMLKEMIRDNTISADRFVIEGVASYGMSVGAEVFSTCIWIGRFIEAWTIPNRRNEPDILYRKDVKMHLCQSMRAKDNNIKQALIDKLGAPGTKKQKGPTHGITKHLWSALAVAVTYAETILSDG